MKMDSRVCLLTNFIPPYYVSVLRHLCAELNDFRIFLSTPMETNRNWSPVWKELPVNVQNSLTVSCLWRPENRFSETISRHIPYDTLGILLRDRPDVVISAQLGFRSLQSAFYRRLCRQSRLIIWTALSEETERGLDSARIFLRKRLLRCADAVLANGESAKRYLSALGVPREKMFLLPYCAEIAPFLELPLEREPAITRRLLYVGQLVSRKGLGPFLSVLSEWMRKRPDTQGEFWIAGDGPLRGELEKFPAPPQLRLHFLGSVPYEKLPELYAQAGMLVLPTLADEWGVVVNEALAAGLPVLGSVYSQAVQELIEHGVQGWTFRPDFPDETHAAIDQAMSVPDDLLLRMRRAGRKRARAIAPEFGAKCFLAAVEFVRSHRQGQIGGKGLPTDSVSGAELRIESP
jgi:glycosyltransferase involved in cell wall biosynthesis